MGDAPHIDVGFAGSIDAPATRAADNPGTSGNHVAVNATTVNTATDTKRFRLERCRIVVMESPILITRFRLRRRSGPMLGSTREAAGNHGFALAAAIHRTGSIGMKGSRQP